MLLREACRVLAMASLAAPSYRQPEAIVNKPAELAVLFRSLSVRCTALISLDF